MSNKTQLQTNNAKYASLIETLRSKSAGSSGGNVETVVLTVTGMQEPGMQIYYIDETMSLQVRDIVRGDSYNIVKNSIFVITNRLMETTFCGYSAMCGDGACRAFQATKQKEEFE